MPVGKLGWQVNPDVQCALEFVARVRGIAHAYHSTVDPQVRRAAQRDWDAALNQVFGAAARFSNTERAGTSQRAA